MHLIIPDLSTRISQTNYCDIPDLFGANGITPGEDLDEHNYMDTKMSPGFLFSSIKRNQGLEVGLFLIRLGNIELIHGHYIFSGSRPICPMY